MQRAHQLHLKEAGCDEAGRGCLAGPVVAAAVLLPDDFFHPLLKDSKQMTEAQRAQLRVVIEKEALAWGVGMLSAQEIDIYNILNASFQAMHRAIDQLAVRPDCLLIDGNRFRAYPGIAHVCMVKGDARFANIAAASVLAKTHRDAFMADLAREWPQYGWDKNKGYPTEAHRRAIALHGPSPFHRLSFRLLPASVQASLFEED